jgi:hypothetical protein
MIISNRFLVIGLSLSLLLLIFELVRKRRLKEKYAILWVCSGILILIFALFKGLLQWVTTFFGIILPVNTVFFFGIFFIMLINIHFSLVISDISEQNKKIAQKLALMESKLVAKLNHKD